MRSFVLGFTWCFVLQAAVPSTIWASVASASLASDASGETWHLPELIAEAKAHNPAILQARKRWEAVQAKIPLAKGLPPPRIGVQFEEIPRGTVQINQATVLYQLIQMLPFPGKLSMRHQVAVKEAQVAAAAFKQAEWDVVSELKQAYYDLFLLERTVEIEQARVVWIQDAEATARARYETGTVGQAELLRLQGETLSASNAVEVLRHRREAMAAHLNHLLNRAIHAPVGHPETPPLEPLSFTTDELMMIAEERQPELLVMKYSLERAEAQYRLSKRELLPDVETMFALRDPAMGPIGPWDLTLAFVLPFWFWTKLQYGVKAALYDKESMAAAYEAMRNEIARRIHEHWHEAAASYQTARLCREGLLPLAREAVASVLSAYESGRASSTEVLETLRALTEQERTYDEHLVSWEQHVVLLEQATGIPLRTAHADQTKGGAP